MLLVRRRILALYRLNERAAAHRHPYPRDQPHPPPDPAGWLRSLQVAWPELRRCHHLGSLSCSPPSGGGQAVAVAGRLGTGEWGRHRAENGHVPPGRPGPPVPRGCSPLHPAGGIDCGSDCGERQPTVGSLAAIRHACSSTRPRPGHSLRSTTAAAGALTTPSGGPAWSMKLCLTK